MKNKEVDDNLSVFTEKSTAFTVSSKNSKLSDSISLKSKGIRKKRHTTKKYSPLEDKGRVYVYEDDPELYMKARK